MSTITKSFLSVVTLLFMGFLSPAALAASEVKTDTGVITTGQVGTLTATSVGSNLIPTSTGSNFTLGDGTHQWSTLDTLASEYWDGTNSYSHGKIFGSTGTTTPAGHSAKFTITSTNDSAGGNANGSNIAIYTGPGSSSGSTKSLYLETGNVPFPSGSGASGAINIQSGTAAGDTSGSINIQTGLTDYISGTINLQTGTSESPFQSGGITIQTGNENGNGAYTTGALTFSTGNTGSSGTATGDISFTTGTGSASRGQLKFVDGSQALGVGALWSETDTNGHGTWQYPTVPQVLYTSPVMNSLSTGLSNSSFTNFSNTATLTFTPTTTGTYKVYSVVTVEDDSTASPAVVRISNSAGSATLLEENQSTAYSASGTISISIIPQSYYTLIAGQTYSFVVQGKVASGGNIFLDGTQAAAYIFAKPVYQLQASAAVTTLSSAITTNESFTTFSQSPTLTFTPTLTGNYKVYSEFTLKGSNNSSIPKARIFNSAGSATLVAENQTSIYQVVTSTVEQSVMPSSVYTLTAGTSYSFQIQGTNSTGGGSANMFADGTFGQYFLFAELDAPYVSSVSNAATANVATTSYTTFDSNAPQLTFTPAANGIYAVYANPTVENGGTAIGYSAIRVFNSSGNANLLYQAPGVSYNHAEGTGTMYHAPLAQSFYQLQGGTSYTFVMQGKVSTTTATVRLDGNHGQFYLMADLVQTGGAGLQPIVSTNGVGSWIAWTPTFQGLGTPTNVHLYYRQVGENMEVMGSFTTGTVSGSEVQIGLPNSLSTSSTLLPANTLTGLWRRGVTSATLGQVIVAASHSYFGISLADGSNNPGTAQTGSSCCASSEVEYIHGMFPISGWTSGGVGNSNVIAIAYVTTGGSVTNDTQINFDHVVTDTRSAITTGAGWKFTAPDTAQYHIGFKGSTTGTATTCYVAKNGTNFEYMVHLDGSSFIHGTSFGLDLNAGDFIDFRCDATATITGKSGAQPTTSIEIHEINTGSAIKYAWGGGLDGDCQWTSTSTSFAEPSTAAGACTLTERTNNNFGTVSKYGTGNGLPGITFTPAAANILYQVCAAIESRNGNTSVTDAMELSDTNGTVIGRSITSQSNSAANTGTVAPVCGIYKSVSISSVSLRFKLKVSAGTITVGEGAGVGNGDAIGWTIYSVGP